jgi:AraC-like DNA-binding protein
MASISEALCCDDRNLWCSVHFMTVNDTFADIAALLHPMPAHTDDDDEFYGDMAEGVLRERDELAENLRLAWDHGEEDPLLSMLEQLRAQRLRLEAEMRLLIAYGRCFTHPRPYKLIDLANAAGMSISGVRTAYDAEEIDQAAEILHRRPAATADAAASEGPAASATT